MRRALLIAAVAAAGCGGGGGLSREEAVARAGSICQESAIPGIPTGRLLNRAVRMAELTRGQERRELERLRTVGWKDKGYRAALDVFAGALPHLVRFVREARAGRATRAADERESYDKAIGEWQTRAGAIGLDLCSRYGFAF